MDIEKQQKRIVRQRSWAWPDSAAALGLSPKYGLLNVAEL